MFKNYCSKIYKDESGFSLLELVVVIVIISVLSLMAAQNMNKRTDASRVAQTLAEMEQIKYAIVGNPDLINSGMRVNFGYVGDMGALPTSLTQLVTTQGGNWNGPYMDVDFAENPNDYLNDAYGQAYTFTSPFLQVYSPGSTTTLQIASTTTELLSNSAKLLIKDRNGFTPNSTEQPNFTVVLDLQSGGAVNGTVGNGGLCTLTGLHIGIHQVSVTYTTTGEMIIDRVIVYPGQTTGPLEIIFTNF